MFVMNKLKKFENNHLEKLKDIKKIPNFKPGDIVTVYVKIIEKKRERTQAFEGVCIAKKNAGINSSFTIRKISYGEGVERIFPLYSPNVAKIEVDGIEHLILSGAEKVLKNVKSVLIEVNENLVEQKQACENKLTESGLKLFKKTSLDYQNLGILKNCYNHIWVRQ